MRLVKVTEVNGSKEVQLESPSIAVTFTFGESKYKSSVQSEPVEASSIPISRDGVQTEICVKDLEHIIRVDSERLSFAISNNINICGMISGNGYYILRGYVKNILFNYPLENIKEAIFEEDMNQETDGAV